MARNSKFNRHFSLQGGNKMGFQQGFRINTNTASLDTYRNYSASQAGMERNIERLSSGLRINKAADDSAGLSISNRMDNQVRGLQQANRNVQQGNNLLQTAEGGLNEISNILGRMRELAVQGASDGVNGDDRASIKLEMDQLSAEITRIADSTEYNDTKVINGNLGNKLDASDTAHTLDSVTNLTTSTINTNNKNAAAGTYSITVTNALTATGATVDGGNVTIKIENDGDSALSQTLTIAHNSNSLAATAESNAVTELKLADDAIFNFDQLGIKLEVDGTDGVTTGSGTGEFALTGENLVIGADSGATLQVGADNNTDNQIGFSLGGQTAAHLGVDSTTLALGDTNANFQSAIGKLDDAIKLVNDERGNIGAKQNRLEFTSSNLMNSVQNNAASMSTIRDADFAAEAADLAKNQILVQSGTAMLAQANGLSQNVLALIR
jgi:flagellin